MGSIAQLEKDVHSDYRQILLDLIIGICEVEHRGVLDGVVDRAISDMRLSIAYSDEADLCRQLKAMRASDDSDSSENELRLVAEDFRTVLSSKLLIVDDVALNRDLLSRRFQRRGFEVVEAPSGRAALDLIESQGFDLVLLDVVMPDMDGLEVLKRIRGRHSSGSLPVIMVTGKSEGQDIATALAHGANDYITKPVDFSVALACVEAQIQQSRADKKTS